MSSIAKLWTRGSVEEIAQYLELNVRTVRVIARKMGLREGTNQLVLWTAYFNRKKARRVKTRRRA